MSADLHIHTYYSDSTLSPQEVVEYAYRMGIKTIAVTDHDTVDGIKETMFICQSMNIELIPAIELSAWVNNSEIHILGYFIDWQDQCFNEQLLKIQQVRVERVQLIIKKLKKQGISIDYNRVKEVSIGSSIGRLHIAQVMYESKMVFSIPEAFVKYLGHHCPAYVEKFKLTPLEAIEMIKRVNGVAVLAHPGVSNCDALIPELIEVGLQGIEVYHPQQNNIAQYYYIGIANKYKLLITGGSDCHGLRKGMVFIGKIMLDDQFVGQLRRFSQGIKNENDS